MVTIPAKVLPRMAGRNDAHTNAVGVNAGVGKAVGLAGGMLVADGFGEAAELAVDVLVADGFAVIVITVGVSVKERVEVCETSPEGPTISTGNLPGPDIGTVALTSANTVVIWGFVPLQYHVSRSFGSCRHSTASP